MATQASFRFDWDLLPKQVNAVPPPVVIDDLDGWLRGYEELCTKVGILQNPRFLAIMKQPKWQIAELPDNKVAKQQFYCGSCAKIPFPWARDPEINKAEEAVYLCVKGHTTCRTCYRMKGKCIFGVQDCENIYGASPPPSIIGELQPVRSSVGNWGELKICSGSWKKTISCKLMTDAINKAEFACKNYYNWCTFRGRGKALTEHERTCRFRDKQDKKKKSFKINKEEKHVEMDEDIADEEIGDVIDIFGSPEYHRVSPEASEYNSDIDDDDKGILNFDLEQTRKQVLKMIEDSQAKIKSKPN